MRSNTLGNSASRSVGTACTTASARPNSRAQPLGSVGVMSGRPSSRLINEVGYFDHRPFRSPPSHTGAKPPSPSRARSTRCSSRGPESSTGNWRTTALNAGFSVSTLHVSACWPPSRRAVRRITADEPARRRTSSSAPDEGRASDRVIFQAGCEKSGRQDLNLRPLGPQPSALPDCATPRGCFHSAVSPARRHGKLSLQHPTHRSARGGSSTVEPRPSKAMMRVRFPSAAFPPADWKPVSSARGRRR